MVILPHRRKAFRTVPQSGGGGGDPYFENVVLLLHADGTNGSTTFTDNSPSPKTITAFGNAQISTTSPKFGTGAALFDGSGDYLTIPADSGLNFGTDPFTIEWFGRFNSVSGIQYFFDIGLNGTMARLMNGNTLLVIATTAVVISATITTLVANTYYHFALTRSGSSWNFYVDGISVASGTDTRAAGSSVGVLSIGQYGGGGFNFNGRMDEIRITKGVARYTSNFTPPTQAFPDFLDESVDPYWNQVSLLLPFTGTNGSTTFVDRSVNGFTKTSSSAAAITTSESKWGGSSCYTTGHIRFPASSAFNFGTGDLTIEMWARYDAFPFEAPSFFGVTNAVGINQYIVGISQYYTPAQYQVYTAAGYAGQFNHGLTAGVWSHFAIVRSSGTIRIYINGLLKFSVNYAGSLGNDANYPIIGSEYGGVYSFRGHCQDFRITKGVARYISNFTPPTRAFATP